MSRGGQRPVTIADVASEAGVSQASVSRVLNGRTTVDPAIAARVTSAVQRLGYRPNATAQSLAHGRTQTIAIIVPDLENPMFQGILQGFSRAAARDGYRVLVADTAEDPSREIEVAVEARRRCDAVVVVAPRVGADELRGVIPTLDPVVIVNRNLGDVAPVVAIDYESAIKELVGHLTDYGHRRIVYLQGPTASASEAQRQAGLLELEQLDPSLEIVRIATGSRLDDGYAVAEAALDAEPTAIVAFNDLVALGLLSRLRELDVAVPARVSVAGIDDISLARYAAPSLTTMSVPRNDVGAQAWERLKARIDGERLEHPLYFRPRLVTRQSTGPVPGTIGWVGTDPLDAYVDGSGAVTYIAGARIDRSLSPRPYAHPIRTLGGVVVTDVRPEDHLHHLGVSAALPDVNGTSYWGGRTFVRDEGSVMRANHGVQSRIEARAGGGALAERLDWRDEHDAHQLSEDRTLTVAPFDAEGLHGYSFRWASELHADAGPLSIGSPATNGRDGAGYGGLFWRFPSRSTRVVTSDGRGERAAHGSRSRWLALSTSDSTVVLVQPADAVRPWFVRVEEYVGAGPALAWDERLEVPAGETLVLELTAIILDGTHDDPAVIERLVARLDGGGA